MKLRLFVGSSSESKPVVEALSSALQDEYEVVPWFNDEVFDAGSTALRDLLRAAEESHLGIFVYAPDDRLVIRGAGKSIPRDNVLFELGMFMSKLGPRGCFPLVANDVPDLRVLSDLDGLTTLRFNHDQFAKDPVAALKLAIEGFRRAHKSLNTDDDRRPEIAGLWDLVWIVESDHFDLVNTHTLELAQVGGRVLGEYMATPKNAKEFSVRFDGTIEKQALTGRWSGAGYSGVFQLAINPTWSTMTGRWIGPSERDGIKSGLYQWRRRS